MNLAYGRVLRVQYRDAQPKLAADTSVFEVTYVTPSGDTNTHELPNGEWLIGNHTLQFMAVQGIKPSDIDGTEMDVRGWHWVVPQVFDGDEYKLHQLALAGGEKALRKAEWFNASDNEESNSDDSDATDDNLDNGPSGGAEKTADKDESGVVASGDVGVELVE